jgi:hypothetical protein
MRDSLETLPPEGKLRFMAAPETYYRIAQLRKEPTESIVRLCKFLNGETALYGCGIADKQYWTALGDFYYSGANGREESAEKDSVTWVEDQNFRAPRLAGTIPIDFFSPNIASTRAVMYSDQLVEFSPAERVAVCRQLEEAFNRIEQTSEHAARLIKDFVKVIIPLKVIGSSGSTSQVAFPGRVLLRGLEHMTLGKLASALVHEAMHQLLYIVEYAGKFVVRDLGAKRPARVSSLWTGRELELHSFIHACFVWYGLSQFWRCAQSSDAFKPDTVHQELYRCLAGFRNQNPVEALGAHSRLLRDDILAVALSLQDHLRDVMRRNAA